MEVEDWVEEGSDGLERKTAKSLSLEFPRRNTPSVPFELAHNSNGTEACMVDEGIVLSNLTLKD